MRKFAHILAFFILFIGSSSDTIEAFAPVKSNVCNSAVKDRQQQQHKNNTQDAGDHIIINRFCNHFINRADQLSQRTFYSILSLPLFHFNVLLPAWKHLSPTPLQEPGYGNLFLYYLF
ncbi:hypothetical protein [Niabella beijingensis]|uniref:hypothetical protein n=1 Tax=Niabella beijingensis TaxID=2872700 RepID=UPI001CBE9E03|nr:hypothetical protein [Niabella beijingensis]MBZ4188136.1 hypothetical protein [Niabella beijingensis]